LITDLVEAPDDRPYSHHAPGRGKRLLQNLQPIDLILIVKALHLLDLPFDNRQDRTQLAERPAHFEKNLDAIGGRRSGCGWDVRLLLAEALLNGVTVVDRSVERAHHLHRHHQQKSDDDDDQHAAANRRLFQAACGLLFHSTSALRRIIPQ